MNDNETRRLREDVRGLEDSPASDFSPPKQSQHWVGVTVANSGTFPTTANVFYWVKAVPVFGQEVAGQPGVFGDSSSTAEGMTNSKLCFNLGGTIPIEGAAPDSKGGSLVVVCDTPFRSTFVCNGTEPLYGGDPP